MKKFALVCCSKESLESLSGALCAEDEHWDVLMPDMKDFLVQARGYDGYVISGSVLSVIEDASTLVVRNVLALIREVYTSSTSPVLGICFGSQAIAAALGGRVERNSDGHFRLGVEPLIWSQPGDPARWPETLVRTLIAQSHGECIVELPPHSKVLASSSTAPYEIFLVHDRLLGVQGHPEVDNRALQEGFMAFHRSMFDIDQWQVIENESNQLIERDAVIGLGRRLLLNGHL